VGILDCGIYVKYFVKVLNLPGILKIFCNLDPLIMEEIENEKRKYYKKTIRIYIFLPDCM